MTYWPTLKTSDLALDCVLTNSSLALGAGTVSLSLGLAVSGRLGLMGGGFVSAGVSVSSCLERLTAVSFRLGRAIAVLRLGLGSVGRAGFAGTCDCGRSGRLGAGGALGGCGLSGRLGGAAGRAPAVLRLACSS